MRRPAAPFGGAWPETAASITDPAEVNCTWFDRLLVEGSWHRDRVVLTGDAAHVYPPTLAQGAAKSLPVYWRVTCTNSPSLFVSTPHYDEVEAAGAPSSAREDPAW